MKLTSSLIAAALMLSACATPKLPDPSISIQPVPEALLTPARKPQPIPTEKPIVNSN